MSRATSQVANESRAENIPAPYRRTQRTIAACNRNSSADHSAGVRGVPDSASTSSGIMFSKSLRSVSTSRRKSTSGLGSAGDGQYRLGRAGLGDQLFARLEHEPDPREGHQAVNQERPLGDVAGEGQAGLDGPDGPVEVLLGDLTRALIVSNWSHRLIPWMSSSPTMIT